MRNIKTIFCTILCMAFVIVCAACNQTVPVTKIAFRDNVVELLVGEEYDPDIIFTPTYATNKTATLKTNNPTVFTIVDNKIYGRAEGAGILTAISNDGRYNASIEVRVYKQPIQLSVPTNLIYDGEKIVFTSSVDSFNYRLKVNGVEHNLGNNNYYSNFATGQVNTVQVMAVGNERASLSSAYSSEYKFYQINTPSNLMLENNIFTFGAISGVANYSVIIQRDNETPVERIISTNSVDLTSNLGTVGNYNIKVKAIKTNFLTTVIPDYSLAVNIIDSKYSNNLSISRTSAPTNLRVENNLIMFDKLNNNASYKIKISQGLNTIGEYDCGQNNYFALPNDISAGSYEARVKVSSGDNFIDSSYSLPLTITRLATPIATISNGQINISQITNATGYYLILNSKKIDIGNNLTYALGKSFVAGNYTIGVQAYSNVENFISSAPTDINNLINTVKLETAGTLSVANKILAFTSTNDILNNPKYEISIDDEIIATITDLEYLFDMADFITAKNYRINVRAISDNENILYSDWSETTNIQKLTATTGLNLENETLIFGAVENASQYEINITNISTLENINIISNTTSVNLGSYVETLGSGEFEISVVALGNNLKLFNSSETILAGMKILATPLLSVVNNLISWNAVADANSYNLYANDLLIETNNNSLELDNTFASGEYSIKIKAIGNGTNILSSVYTAELDILLVEKLDKITGFAFSDNTLTWIANPNATSYEISDGTDIVATLLTNQYVFDEGTFDLAKEYRYFVKAIGGSIVENKNYLNAELSLPYTITRLNKLANLQIQGNNLVWNNIQNCTYTLEIENGATLSDLTDNYISLYDEDTWAPNENFTTAGDYRVRVKILGNEPNILESNFTDYMTINKLDIPSNISVENSNVLWDVVSIASGYQVMIDGVNYDSNLDNTDAVSNILSSSLIQHLDAGIHTVKVVATGDNTYTFASNISNEISFTTLSAPVVTFNENIFNWSVIENADRYFVELSYIDNESNLIRVYEQTTNIYYSIVDLNISGDLTCNVYADCNADDNYVISKASQSLALNKLTAPTLYILDGVLRWNSVEGANLYILTIPSIIDFEPIVYSGASSYDFSGIPAGSYVVNMVAKNGMYCSGDANYSDIIANSYTTSFEAIKLATPNSLAVNKGKFQFTSVENAESYKINVGYSTLNVFVEDPTLIQLYGDIICESALPNRIENATITAKATGYINSETSEPIKVNMLSTVSDIAVSDELINWSPVENASGYYVYIYLTDGVHIINSMIQDVTGENSTSVAFPEFSEEFGAGNYMIYIRAYGGQYLDAGTGDTVYYSISKRNSSTTLATRLSAPTNVRSVDGVIYWNGDEKATGYQLMVNDDAGQVITISSNTNYYVLPDSYIEGLYNIKVMALGNNNEILSSIYSESRDFLLLRAVENVTVEAVGTFVENGDLVITANNLFKTAILTFTSVLNPTYKYVKTISFEDFALRNSEFVVPNLSDMTTLYGEDYTTWTYSDVFNSLRTELSYFEIPIDMEVGKYTLTIKLVGNSFAGETNVAENQIAILSSKTLLVGEIIKLPTPVVSVDDGVVSWDAGEIQAGMIYEGNREYIVYIQLSNGTIYKDYTTSNYIDFKETYYTFFNSASMELNAGTYLVSVRLKGDNTKFLTSETSNSQMIKILNAPSFWQTKGYLQWDNIVSADGYQLDLINSELEGGELSLLLDKSTVTFDLSEKMDDGISDYPAGIYNIKITAKGNGIDVLDSKSYTLTTKTKYDIASADFTLANGLLVWNRIGSTNLYDIDIDGTILHIALLDELGAPTSDKISISPSGVISYELPDNISVAVVHTIKIKAISDDAGYLNSNYSNSVSGIKFDSLFSNTISNGILNWTVPSENAENINGYYVRVKFNYNDELKTKVFVVSQNSFVLPNQTEIDNIVYDLAGGDYIIDIKIMGNNSYFNSNYNSSINVTRLDDITNLRSENGVLTWDSVADNEYYILNYGAITGIQIASDETSFDCISDANHTFASGDVNITMQAYAYNKLNSRTTALTGFEKLARPTNLNVGEIYITWDAVVANNVSATINYLVEIKSASGADSFYETISTNEYRLGNSYSEGTYFVRIQAISSTNLMLNSDFSDASTVSKPATVTGLTFNDDTKRWEWDAVVGVNKYAITYLYKQIDGQTTSSYTQQLLTNYFKPIELGTYSAFNVQALVSGSVASDSVQWQDDFGNISYLFNLYESGNGTVATPYKVGNFSQLCNLDYYSSPSVYFELSRNITISSNATGVIGIRKEFEGYFDGKNYTIKSLEINGTSNYKGIFARANNATIKNVVLDQIKLSGDVANSIVGLYAGILVGYGTDLVIDNITIQNTDISSYENLSLDITTISANTYVGGLIGYTKQSQISNINIKINSNLYFESQTSANIYLGGLIGYVDFVKDDLTTITSAKVQLTDSTNCSNMFKLGGLVAYNTGNITNSRAILTMTNYANNVGGLVAYNVGNISNSYSSGTIKGYGLVNESVQRIGLAGGIAGENTTKDYISLNTTQTGTITNCYSLANVEITTSIPIDGDGQYSAYAGGIAGKNSGGVISNCWVANGTISNTGNISYSASIVGYNSISNNLTDCYYTQDNIASYGYYNTSEVVRKTLEEMQNSSFVDLINQNAGDIIWIAVANGLPIFAWQ